MLWAIPSLLLGKNAYESHLILTWDTVQYSSFGSLCMTQKFPSLWQTILNICSQQGFGDCCSEYAFTPINSSLYVGLLISMVISCFVDEALINVKSTSTKISQLSFAFVKPSPFAFVWRWQFQLQPQPNRAPGKGYFSGFIENKASLARGEYQHWSQRRAVFNNEYLLSYSTALTVLLFFLFFFFFARSAIDYQKNNNKSKQILACKKAVKI